MPGAVAVGTLPALGASALSGCCRQLPESSYLVPPWVADQPSAGTDGMALKDWDDDGAGSYERCCQYAAAQGQTQGGASNCGRVAGKDASCHGLSCHGLSCHRPIFDRAANGAGDREGRFLTALSDGRVLATWGLAHDPRGVHYSLSAPGGKVWNRPPFHDAIGVLVRQAIAVRTLSNLCRRLTTAIECCLTAPRGCNRCGAGRRW